MSQLETWPTTAGAGVNIYLFTFFTVFSFISGVAGARAHDANATAPALGINALRCRHVALGALPAAVAEAASFGVLPVAAAQYRAGCCGIKHDRKIWIEFFHQRFINKNIYGACCMPISFLMYLFSCLLRLTWGEDWAEVPLEQSGPRKPGKQWQDPETHSPLPWQFRGHSTTDSAGKKAGSLTDPTARSTFHANRCWLTAHPGSRGRVNVCFVWGACIAVIFYSWCL